LHKALFAALAIALLAASAGFAQQTAGEPVEPLPISQPFHPSYTLRADQETAPVPSPTATATPDPDDMPVEPLPPDDPVAQGFEQATWTGDIEDLPARRPSTQVASLRLPPQVSGEPRMVFISPQPDEEWLEGTPVTLKWLSSGPITQVRIYYYYDRCRLGGRSRGSFGDLVTPMIPNTGQHTWARVPWMDATAFRLRIAGYDEGNNCLASDEIGLYFRPRELQNIPATCIAIVKHRQRLYYFAGGRPRRMHIVSTARSPFYTPTMRPGSYDRRRGAMGKVFGKQGSAWSRRYHCAMPYWLQITSSGSHGIHATSPRFYGLLGGPASHGCVRQHRADASILFRLVPVGTSVYVF